MLKGKINFVKDVTSKNGRNYQTGQFSIAKKQQDGTYKYVGIKINNFSCVTLENGLTLEINLSNGMLAVDEYTNKEGINKTIITITLFDDTFDIVESTGQNKKAQNNETQNKEPSLQSDDIPF